MGRVRMALFLLLVLGSTAAFYVAMASRLPILVASLPQPRTPCPPSATDQSVVDADMVARMVTLVENNTRLYSIDEVQRQVAHYKEHVNIYKNKADFMTIRAVMDFYNKSGRCDGTAAQHVTMILGGANKGQSTANILDLCPGAHMHIFEIQKELVLDLTKRFRGFQVFVHNVGFHDASSDMTVTLPGKLGSETAGLYSATAIWSGRKSSTSSKYTVPVMPLSHIVTSENITGQVAYTLIDVEGHEPNAIKGMRLDVEENRRTFPIFQFELGGTWADARHDANQWGQYAVSLYLKTLGYSLFLMGQKDGTPVLWDVAPELFRMSTRNSNRITSRYYVQGNLLAVHRTHIDPALWSSLSAFVFKVG